MTEEPHPFPPDRMTPTPETALAGRVNPEGIPCLYLATERDTAMAECRPWLQSYLSLGQFRVVRPLKVVNCTVKSHRIYLGEEPEPEGPERASYVWGDIDFAFSVPVSRAEDVSQYIPTQILSELFKVNGFDGVAYRSALGDGHNVALFDLASAKLRRCFLYDVRRIKYEFSEAGQGYEAA